MSIAAAAALLAWTAGAGRAAPPVAAGRAAPERLRITVTKKTADQRAGPNQQVGHASARAHEAEMLYRLEFQRLVPSVPENLTVEWLIVVQGAGGNLRPGAHGTDEIVLPPGRTAAMDTKPVTLKGWEWTAGAWHGSGAIREDLYGYAIRVRDDRGTLVGEKYVPKDVEKRADALIEELQKQDNWKKVWDNIGKPPQAPEPKAPAGKPGKTP